MRLRSGVVEGLGDRERLVGIVRNMTAEQALAMGQKKAMAMIDLAAATR